MNRRLAPAASNSTLFANIQRERLPPAIAAPLQTHA